MFACQALVQQRTRKHDLCAVLTRILYAVLNELAQNKLEPLLVGKDLKVEVLAHRGHVRRDELTRVGFYRTRHQGLEIPAANQVVALHDFRARVVQRLVDIALHASQLTAQVIHARQVVFAAVQVFQNQVSRRQGQLGLVDPALDIVAIVIGLTPAFGSLVAGSFAHPS